MGLDLTSYLIAPVQRIPRYVMLLEDLLKYTPQEHEDAEDLRAAVDKMREVADYVNEKKREAENLNKVLRVQEVLSGKIELLEDASRRFVREGPLVDMSGAEKKNRYYFLFNDSLVASQQSAKEFKESWRISTANEHLPPAERGGNAFKFKSKLDLANSGLKEPGKGLATIDDKWKSIFQLVTPLTNLDGHKSQQQIFTFLAPSPTMKDSWMSELDDCISQQLDAKRTRLAPAALLEPPAGLKDETDFSNPEIATKLYMKNNKDEWVRRYCVLQKGALYWFKDASAAKPKGHQHVLACSVRLLRPSDRNHAFQLFTPSRIYSFAAYCAYAHLLLLGEC